MRGKEKCSGKVLETAWTVFESAESSGYTYVKSLERTRLYGVGDSVAPVGLDCKGVDAASTLTSRVFSELRETYDIPPSVGLLRPAPEDRPSRPRDGFAAVTIRSLICGLRLPFPVIVQQILTRLGVHACQMSTVFYRLFASGAGQAGLSHGPCSGQREVGRR